MGFCLRQRADIPPIECGGFAIYMLYEGFLFFECGTTVLYVRPNPRNSRMRGVSLVLDHRKPSSAAI